MKLKLFKICGIAKICRDTLTLYERVLLIESGEPGSLLEMDLGLQLQMDPCPVTETGGWNCLMSTIMGAECCLWNVVTSTSSKPSIQAGEW